MLPLGASLRGEGGGGGAIVVAFRAEGASRPRAEWRERGLAGVFAVLATLGRGRGGAGREGTVEVDAVESVRLWLVGLGAGGSIPHALDGRGARFESAETAGIAITL